MGLVCRSHNWPADKTSPVRILLLQRKLQEMLLVLKAGVLWFVLLIACDGNPDNLTSTMTSTMNWWYKDNHSACHLYDVQDSDDAVEVGTLAFSGVHCDHFRLARVLDLIFRAHNGGARLKFGVTVKMSKGYPKNEGNFNFPKHHLAVVSADRMDAQPVRTILYREFNCHPDPLQRPGQHNF